MDTPDQVVSVGEGKKVAYYVEDILGSHKHILLMTRDEEGETSKVVGKQVSNGLSFIIWFIF